MLQLGLDDIIFPASTAEWVLGDEPFEISEAKLSKVHCAQFQEKRIQLQDSNENDGAMTTCARYLTTDENIYRNKPKKYATG